MDEEALITGMRRLAASHPRYGYRRIHRLLLVEGWSANHKRIQRLWRREGMRVPRKRRRTRRMGNASNSSSRRYAEAPNHVWSYDFVFDRTEGGRPIKSLTMVDEFERESLCTPFARSIIGDERVGILASIMAERGTPKYIRSDRPGVRCEGCALLAGLHRYRHAVH